MTMGWGTNSRTFSSNAQINTLVFNGGAPIAVVVNNGPSTGQQKVNADLGFFVQDTWTMRRLTLNVGGRYDHFDAEVPAQSSAPGPWIQARNFSAIERVPHWNDWSVRTAVADDLFGTGKTALKANASKYIAAAASGFAQNFNPMSYSTQQRGWFDADNNRSILDAAGNIQFAEVLGGTSNFGQITSRPDPDLARGYNWEYSASIQHELMPKVNVTGGYFRRKFYNLDVTDNLNLSPSEWNSFTITVPNDTRLSTAGQQITMYSLNANKVGTPTDNLRTYSGINRSTYNGVEFSANVRFSKALIFGGVTTERRATESCDERDNPNGLRFCDAVPPFRTTYKMSAAYNLPYDFQLSGVFISTPGPSVSANYTVTNQIAGRTIIGNTAGSNTIGVNLIEPNTMFLDRRKQLDLRVGRTFRFGKYRIQGFADIFNVLNLGTVLRVNETYGSNPATNAWLTPLTIMDGRYIRFGTQMSF